MVKPLHATVNETLMRFGRAVLALCGNFQVFTSGKLQTNTKHKS